MNKLIPKLVYDDIYFEPVNTKNINLGWLRWMNDPELTKYLDSESKHYTANDLKRYLDNNSAHSFLACYRKVDDTYIGNLRVYQLLPGIFSYGLLIDKKYHRKGYGTKFCKVAVNLVFNWLGGNLVVASSQKKNKAPTLYKIKVGFCPADSVFLSKWGLQSIFSLSNPVFYMDKKIFLSRQSDN